MVELGISQLHNPWWVRPELILEDSKILEFEGQKFKWYPKFYDTFPKTEDVILTLRGPRQVGKTTLLKLLIRRLLLEDNIDKERIFFYPCDRVEDFNEMYALLEEYLNFVRPRSKGRIFIFLDEISFVKEWPRAIKDLVDSGLLKGTTLVLTGSNILDIKFSSERLPGRRGAYFRPDIELLPLTFRELVSLVKPELSLSSPEEALLHLADLQKIFDDYLLVGGFPGVINHYYTNHFIPAYLYEIYLNWIEGDLHKVGKSEELGMRIFSVLFESLTSPTSWYRLAKQTGIISHGTVEEYIEILEKMFVLFRVPFQPLHQRRPDYKKNRKIYLTDPFIFNVLKSHIDGFLDDAFNYSRKLISMGGDYRSKIVEAVVGSTLRRYYPRVSYWQGKDKEIDFIVKRGDETSYIEVKYKTQVTTGNFKWSAKILGKKPLTIITRKNYQRGKLLNLFPLEVFLASQLPDKKQAAP